MNRQQLVATIRQKQSFLCIGLDTDPNRIPKHLLGTDDPVFEFNKAIIDATHDLCVAYKPNIAFYESLGTAGWESLQKTIDYMPEGVFTIADAKRGDIGNTARMYAKTFFHTYGFDSVTVAPYMGSDSVEPFLEYDGKWVIVLALTSNPGANDFQFQQIGEEQLFERVMRTTQEWGTDDNLMFVVGATRGELIAKCRAAAPNAFFLVPGVGAQGGSLQEVAHHAMIEDCGLLVNSSRGIIYAGDGPDFAQQARSAAERLQKEMAELL